MVREMTEAQKVAQALDVDVEQAVWDLLRAGKASPSPQEVVARLQKCVARGSRQPRVAKSAAKKASPRTGDRAPLTRKKVQKEEAAAASSKKRKRGQQAEEGAAAAAPTKKMKGGQAAASDRPVPKEGSLEWYCPPGKTLLLEPGKPLPQSMWPDTVDPDPSRRRALWLPKDWGQGKKNTCKCHLQAFVSPWGTVYYHKPTIEQVLGRKLGPGDGLEASVEWAKERINKKEDWFGHKPKVDADASLLACLSQQENKHVPQASKLHCCVISARRANHQEGIRNIVNVQAHLTIAGVEPTWYVDRESVEDYKKLGLKAVVGGPLTPSRNIALDDAYNAKKVCVQLSDDISAWSYYHGLGKVSGLTEGNLAAKSAKRFRLTPVAAARFLVAKMRGAGGTWPRLGGVHPTGNLGQVACQEPVARDLFILGDFFVADERDDKPDDIVRFDETFRLKEDYDFTCSHIAKWGSVMRLNRMTVCAKHEVNKGGACAVRDNKGEKEREHIQKLQEKWPGVFTLNRTRGEGDTQVVMRWKAKKF